MMYVRLRSWHVRQWHVRQRGGYTLCGRVTGDGQRTADSLPMGERSCESCLRIAAKRGWA